MCNVPVSMNGDVLVAYLSRYGSMEEVLPIRVTDETAHSEYFLNICRDREGFQAVSHSIAYENQQMMVVEGRRTNFCHCFAHCPDLLVQEFHSYLADFLCLREAEAAKVWLLNGKQVSLNKSLGLDVLPDKMYLRLPHRLVPILTDVFNHWFVQGAIPSSLTKGGITLLKKGGRHVWDEQNDYRP